jgi:hypothetical protein
MDASVKNYASKRPGILYGRRLALFKAAFVDPSVIQEAVDTAFTQDATDSWPLITVVLQFPDHALTLGSSSQSPFMLPWAIIRLNRKTFTNNADISHAVLHLIPRGFVNYERLAGTRLESDVAFAVTQHNELALHLPLYTTLQ